MFSRLTKNSSVKHILVMTLSNVGDVVLSFPVLDVLKTDFPDAKLSVIVGPRPQSLFQPGVNVEAVYVYDKHWPLSKKIEFIRLLRAKPFDVFVDLKNSILPFLLPVRYRTMLELGYDKQSHLKQRHLGRLRGFYPFEKEGDRHFLARVNGVVMKVDGLLSRRDRTKPLVVFATRAADSAKTWAPENFSRLGGEMIKRFGVEIIIVGGKGDIEYNRAIRAAIPFPVLDVSGETDLIEAAEILRRSQLAIVHDSGIMHMASYLDIPVIALFGKTDPTTSRPWGREGVYIHKNRNCLRCRHPRSKEAHTCMAAITVDDVLNEVTGVHGGIKLKKYIRI